MNGLFDQALLGCSHCPQPASHCPQPASQPASSQTFPALAEPQSWMLRMATILTSLTSQNCDWHRAIRAWVFGFITEIQQQSVYLCVCI